MCFLGPQPCPALSDIVFLSSVNYTVLQLRLGLTLEKVVDLWSVEWNILRYVQSNGIESDRSQNMIKLVFFQSRKNMISILNVEPNRRLFCLLFELSSAYIFSTFCVGDNESEVIVRVI